MCLLAASAWPSMQWAYIFGRTTLCPARRATSVAGTPRRITRGVASRPELFVRGNADDLKSDPGGWMAADGQVLAHGCGP
jgi:hypothetical protein